MYFYLLISTNLKTEQPHTFYNNILITSGKKRDKVSIANIF